MEPRILTEEDLHQALARVKFNPSCVNLDWKWDVKPVFTQERDVDFVSHRLLGWLVRTSFVRPDTETGEVSRGYGRWELVEVGTSLSGAVKTCWLLAKLIVEHELMEAFTVDGIRIFNPHHTVEELSLPARMKR